MTELLQRGNIIKIKKGMKVYANIPEKFVFSNRPLSGELHCKTVEVGKIYKISKEFKEEYVTGVKKDEVERLRERNFNVTEEQIENLLKQTAPSLESEEYDASILEGEYIVVKTENSDGGTGMRSHDIYSDGWRVFAKKMKDGKIDSEGIEVSFYQTGAFTAMIPPETIEIIGDIFG
ncbi:MAG: hypothetical protein Q4D02_03740 [Clostridia bacterium]|nr:hypothetical protein [Clostridia bacterium]